MIRVPTLFIKISNCIKEVLMTYFFPINIMMIFSLKTLDVRI